MMRLATAATVVAAVAGLTACSSPGSGAPAPTTSSAVVPAATTAPTECKDGQPVTASLPPGGQPAGARIAEIRKRGRLIVGTSADAPLWGATNIRQPEGNPVGFDVSLASQLASDLGVGVEFRVLPLADRQAALNRSVNDRGVDLVAERMTITCARWEGTATAPPVNFSSTYYLARPNGLLVRDDASEKRSKIDDFKGFPVCGVTGSSSLAAVEGAGAQIVTAPSAGQCLVKFIQGEAEAVIGDDTTLAGLQQLDQETRVAGAGAASVPYGLGLPPDDDDFTRWVNGRLADYRGSRLAQWGSEAKAPNGVPSAGATTRATTRLGRSS